MLLVVERQRQVAEGVDHEYQDRTERRGFEEEVERAHRARRRAPTEDVTEAPHADDEQRQREKGEQRVDGRTALAVDLADELRQQSLTTGVEDQSSLRVRARYQGSEC